MNQTDVMDRMYRYQRYIYDATRKYYLFGRDTLINTMTITPGQHVLEMGCGTARNLIKLAQRYPQTAWYGIDASHEMLRTAQLKVEKGGYQSRIRLKQGLAEQFDYQKDFGLNQGFDRVFFSYTLSMIPCWQAALEAGLANTKPGGELYIVDFSDQRDLPRWFRHLLVWWLDLFGVHHQPELLPYLEKRAREGAGQLHVTSLGGHYAFIARFRKTI
ncbi:class I SAM-dependent methyltransferase [Thioflexithrix psekupsensis]|uniref:Methyltransferase type 12 n=1 Tax=Thioflexithrix psekupsensis TaxID=1570016 RepID=A0A251X9N1_9GAMM|nr:class I SAM-dependent methyltransferase [Thioflexithrix psekupsensis]OUD14437.1 methyltransferase type 12 [Thioflexithrix psekupsensis]